MSHAYVRDANLVGALAVGLADKIATATERAGRAGPSGSAALVALHGASGGVSIDGLRRIVGLTHSGAVRLVDRLAGAGLVERRAGADQRSVALRLTPEGRRAARRVLASREAVVEAALAGLPAEDRATLVRIVEHLLPNLVDEPADELRVCRLCDSDACGRPRGNCPVERVRQRELVAARPADRGETAARHEDRGETAARHDDLRERPARPADERSARRADRSEMAARRGESGAKQ
jgi:MarR family transcriptional repressor of emrRAB